MICSTMESPDKMFPTAQIFYVFAVPKWEPLELTPFQGFPAGFMELGPAIQASVTLPTTIVEPTMEATERLARRREGFSSWAWCFETFDGVLAVGEPMPERPFAVIFSADEDVTARIAEWTKSVTIKPLLVSLDPHQGCVTLSDLKLTDLQSTFITALEEAKQRESRLDIGRPLQCLNEWKTLEPRPCSLRFHSHTATMANEMVLWSTGEQAASDELGILGASPEQNYIDGITDSAKAIIDLQRKSDERGAFLIHPERPDILLFAPTTFRGVFEEIKKQNRDRAVRQAIHKMDRQEQYFIDQTTKDLSELKEHLAFKTLLAVRGEELKFQTLMVGLRAASTLTACIRVHPKVNRAGGAVGVFARHIRNYDDDPPDKKTAKVFKDVQEALAASVPEEHLNLIRESRIGVKIVGNAPLEWLPVNGLPLGIWTDVSRINVTPGFSMVEQLKSIPPLHLEVADFTRYLLLSMFEDNDSLAPYMDSGLKLLAREKNLKGTHQKPDSPEAFVDAINSYEGSVLIVDCHGAHPQDPDIGGLIIGGKRVDLWSLAAKFKRVPPIVILSACETHPFDRSHATVANGFLHCGALGVLSTVLPIRGRDAAAFIVRLMLRAIQYGELQTEKGLSLNWTNVVGGALRMHLAFDVVMGLRKRKYLSLEQAQKIQMAANIDLNFPPRSDWLELLGQRCRAEGGFDEAKWQTLFDDILAASDVIRYVNLGNPESIIISDKAWRNKFSIIGIPAI